MGAMEIFVLDYNIKNRHATLTMMFGVKPEEETSLNSTILVISFTVCMTALCFLEVLTYFIYNRKVDIF